MRNSDRPNLKRKMQERAGEAGSARKHLKAQEEVQHAELQNELKELANEAKKLRARLEKMEAKQAACEESIAALQAKQVDSLSKEELLDLLRANRGELKQLKEDKCEQERVVKSNTELINRAYEQAAAEGQCAQPDVWFESVCIADGTAAIEQGKMQHNAKTAETKANVAVAAEKLSNEDITGSLEALFDSQDTLFKWSQEELQPSGTQKDVQEEQVASP